jgi:hypothetical protein
MAKKSLGYVRLEWTCPFCGTRNPGPQKKCTQCNAPQPADVEFEQTVQEELIADQETIRRAKASGPDVHCPYCNTRNAAGATVCANCQAELSEAQTRASGRILGKHRQQPATTISCRYCGTDNPAMALQCSQCGASLAKPASTPDIQPAPRSPKARSRRRTNPLLFLGLALILILCISMGFFYFRTDDITGRITDVSWTLSVGVEALKPVSHEGWYDELPEEAVLLSCRSEPHHTQDEPSPNSVEVCDEPYTIDDGTGFGEVVQDCHYQIYADYCEFTIDEWQEVDQVTLSGQDLNPRWPVLQLASLQREGARSEAYEIVFDSDGRSYTYHTSNSDEFIQCEIGSRWILQVNTFDTVLGIEADG